MNILKDVKKDHLLLLLGIFLLAITRAILLLPVILVILIRIIKKNARYIYIIIPVVLFVLFYFRDMIISKIVVQTISAMEFVNEDASEFAELLDQQYSLSTLILLLKRFGIGLVALLFTPHPINYFQEWIMGHGALGDFGIYTGFDNFLIVIGAIYCYVFLIPRLFWYVYNHGRISNELFCFILSFVLIYVVAYLGVTDIRNRHLFFFYMMIDIIYKESERSDAIKIDGKFYLLSLCVFVGLFMISAV
ncbi:MAG: hypothetical protein IK038_06350 [Bacteroidaceae bacterium]|nr:hypothetical protein [Bacteroidaceae bacterium]